MKYIFKITLLFLLFPLITSANTDEKKHEKSKTIKKEYKVNKDATVALDNKYGNLNITTWDKNRVEIEVTITVKGDDLDSVEDKLESIDVTFENSVSWVSAKTNFRKEKQSWSLWGNNKNINYQINYKVKIPKTNSVDLDNDYGNIYLDDLFGKADVNCDYGKISLGELSADNNSINLDYCSSSNIVFMASGNVNLDYSKITIEKAGTLKVNMDYSTLKIETVENINFNADYGSLAIDEATHVEGNSDYLSMSFGTILKNFTLDTDYGAITIKRLAKDFENVDINSEYTGIRIGVNADTVFDFTLDLQYAGFKTDDDNVEFYKKITKSSKKYYEGKFGKGNSNSRIKIKSQYGGVSIKEN
ncbi:hypothetical protein K8354_02890 [Polaribacter litorisediminis]|uniref:hypothetical protein n=1 Tax=Polaribacter litorisediminis TaxID=1908341 RepID=UPI001CBD3416|nr:hypothetical protein [Polaribacter litorisediminis]UAM98789.1 hypothetical protein K8354_02890 [Polaribacter litorisediminis]